MSLLSFFAMSFTWDELAELSDVGGDISHREFARARLGRRTRRDLREEIKRLAEEGGRHEPVVYFARAGRHVKIGTTTNLRNRMTGLYWGLEDIFAIVPGDRHLEAAYHERFAHCRIKDDGRAELFYLTWNLRVFLSRRRVDFWDVMNSYVAGTIALWSCVWIGPRAFIVALLTFLAGLGFQFMRPGWNYEAFPPVLQVVKEAIAGWRTT